MAFRLSAGEIFGTFRPLKKYILFAYFVFFKKKLATIQIKP
jgi:hypothetical protein